MLAITTVCPRCFCSSGLNGRKMLSVSPPAAHGTIRRTGRSGYAASVVMGTSAIATAMMNLFMRSSSKDAAILPEARHPAPVDAILQPPQRAALRAPAAALRDDVARAAAQQQQRALLRHVGLQRLAA